MDDLAALKDPEVGDHFTSNQEWDEFVVGRVGDWIATLSASRPSKWPMDGKVGFYSVASFLHRHTRGGEGELAAVQLVRRGADVSGWLDYHKDSYHLRAK